MEMIATILLVFLCSASTSFITSRAAGSTLPPAVLDVHGQSLRPGQKYYALPFIRGMGGGIAIRFRDNICPMYVVQAALEVDPGRPVIFTPVNPDEVVRTSTDLNVQVSAITTCMQSNVWKLGDVDEQTGHLYVSIDGKRGNPGKETLRSWFKIENYGETTDGIYKFRFCPAVCDTCRPVCGDLGVFIEGDRRWLGITGDMPFPVQFRLADEAAKGTM